MNTSYGAAGGNGRNPLWAPLALLLAGLSLSIGWAIRGNLGHETGAMVPGALTAIVVCLLSNRDDWRERVGYFALFGALGWGLGGSMSYMQVLAYAQSGHAPSQYYGFFGLFAIGFLWAALGGAGTALPAVLDRRDLCDLFRPLCVVLAMLGVFHFVEDPVARAIQSQFGAHVGSIVGWQRHESALYWFDSNWLDALVVVVGLCAFDLVDRRFGKSLWLPVFAAAGGLIGYLVQTAISRAGWSEAVHELLVHTQGDEILFDHKRLICNWPPAFLNESGYAGRYAGLAVGLIIGIGSYFACFGKFRRGSSLLLHLALGWFVGFLVLPVLFDVRMTPPRGDNWAGMLGVFGGLMIYCVRCRLWPLIAAALVAGAVGGIGFSGAACVEAVCESFGNANLAPGLAQSWTSWQNSVANAPVPADVLGAQPVHHWEFWLSANWHSFLEQSYGFVNGLAVAAAMAVLLRRLGRSEESGPREYWTEIVAVTFVGPMLMWVNLQKDVGDWTSGPSPAMPASMRMPLIGFSLSAWAWFNVFFGVAALAFVVLLNIHTRRRLALLEQSWLGRGQWLYLILLWVLVIGNFGKAVVHFAEQRLLTEGVITLNAVLATMLLLLVPRTDDPQLSRIPARYGRLIARAALIAVICAAFFPVAETLCVRAVYKDAPVLRPRDATHGPTTRFGPHAAWRYQPLQKGEKHR
ncbi:MAG TPA: hypothetical protein VEI07_09080 [Planctomycetaceae bacterium]|nr:hypothetical protein [Planctomycetaceae bacterium]